MKNNTDRNNLFYFIAIMIFMITMAYEFSIRLDAIKEELKWLECNEKTWKD